MDEKEFNQYVKERYEDQVKWYDRKSNRNKRTYEIIQWGVIVFSTITPILVVIGGSWQRWMAAIVAFFVAIGTSLLKAFKYQENWIHYRTTCELLRKEIHYFKAQIDDYKNSKDPRGLFVERVEDLISREHTLWLTIQKREKDNAPKNK